jgi:hypothetical protein
LTAVPGAVPAADAEPDDPPAASPLLVVLLAGGIAIVCCLILALVGFASGRPIAGSLFLLLALSALGTLVAGVLHVASSKVQAIRHGWREVDLFWGLVKLVLWEENEGILVLKNKRVSRVIYGPEQGGGTTLLFPFLGDELKLHVPLTLQMHEFKDNQVVTRESIRLFMKLAIWWKVKDKQGLGDFYRRVNREIHFGDNRGLHAAVVYGPADASRRSQVSRRAERLVAEKWIETLAESCLRKLVSQTSTAFVISTRAASYLHVEGRHDQAHVNLIPQGGGDSNAHMNATPNLLGDQLRKTIDDEVRGRPGVTSSILRTTPLALGPLLKAEASHVWDRETRHCL